MTEFPPIPAQCDYTVLSNNTSGPRAYRICNQTEVLKMPNGWSTCGYIIHRSAAQRLLKASENGFVAMYVVIVRNACLICAKWYAFIYDNN